MNDQATAISLYKISPAQLFSGALIIGGAFIVGANVITTPRETWFVLVGTLTIMGIYIYLIVKNEVEDISREQKADSCYYLGFIFTLVAMVLSLIRFDSSTIEDDRVLQAIVQNFGLALTTTVVGLVARIVWLQLHSGHMADAEETIRTRLFREADSFQLQTQRITSAFKTLAEDAERVTKPLSKNLEHLDTTLSIPEGLSDSLSSLSKKVGSLNDHLSRLDEALEGLKIDSFGHIAQKLQELNSSLTRLNPELERHLKRLNTNLRASSQTIEDYSSALASLLQETQSTYSEVNRSLRENADFIRKELK